MIYQLNKQTILLLTSIVCLSFALIAADLESYSKQELSKDLHKMEYSTQEWKDIASILMNMDFNDSKKDVIYIKDLPIYQNVLIISFLHRWKNNLYPKADYIRQLSGSIPNYDISALKKLFEEKLAQHITEKTVSAEFLTDLADTIAVYKNIYSQEELDDLIIFFPRIESNMLKNGFFYILLSNDFFLRKQLPDQYINYLDTMLLDYTNILRKRLNLPSVKHEYTPEN